jgi:hypothetical protein
MNWEKSQAQILQNALDLANQTPDWLINQQLLRILGARIARGEINFLNPFLFIEQKGQKVISVCLKDGRVVEKETNHA